MTGRQPSPYWVLLVLASISAVARAQVLNQATRCTNQKYFFLDGSTKYPPDSSGQGAKDWGSYAASSRYQPGPCLMMPGIHVIQNQAKKVIIMDRTDVDASYLKLPNGKDLAFALELDLQTGAQRPLNTRTNAVCSTGFITPDGAYINIGGHRGPTYEGFDSVRQLWPCTDNKCDFNVIGKLTSKRWYPASQLLADGRLVIVGGSVDQGSLGYEYMNNPTLEYWPRKQGEGNYRVQLLADEVPYSLYPFTHLLPSGKLFIFAGRRYVLYDTGRNAVATGMNFPALEQYDERGSPIYRSYPLAGTSVLFPLTPGNGYTAEIMICGGSSKAARNLDTSDKKYWADDKCWRITPDQQNPKWTMESMTWGGQRARRLAGDMVILVDGSVLILNGAQQGYQGDGGNLPALQPLIYYTKAHTWYPKPLATSKIARMYHSHAILLHDGTVFVSGSNPVGLMNLWPPFPTEFRSEIFYPPYFYKGKSQPFLKSAPTTITVNQKFRITFQPTQQSSIPVLVRFRVVLAYPSQSTHGQSHGMRQVELKITDIGGTGPVYFADIIGPPSLNVAPPTYYWIHILDNGVPNKEGLSIQVSK